MHVKVGKQPKKQGANWTQLKTMFKKKYSICNGMNSREANWHQIP